MRSYVDVKQSTPSIVASAWEGRANDAKDQQAVSPGQLRSRNCGPGDLSYFLMRWNFMDSDRRRQWSSEPGNPWFRMSAGLLSSSKC